jgi:hypothetical protein
MVDPVTAAIVVALSTMALCVLLNALRKTIARAEWDDAALFGALSVVLTASFVYMVVVYRGEGSAVSDGFQVELLMPAWGVWSVRLANLILVVASAAIFVRSVGRNATINNAAVLFLLVTLVSNVSAVLHDDDPIRPYSVVFLAVLVACTIAPRGLGTHVGIGTCCVIAAIANGLTIVVQPNLSVVPCRINKCGILDFMFRGTFEHENALAMFLVLAMPFVFIGFASWEGPFLSAYLLGLVLFTGSRSGIAAGVVTFVVLILVRPNIRRPTWAPIRTALVYLALAVVFVVGVALPFYVHDPTAYSGRGDLWMLARDALADPATLIHGTGMMDWQRTVQEAGLGNLYSPHNQWLHILYSTGLMGFLLLMAALTQLIWHAGRTYSLVVGCVLLPVFILSVTERPWPIDTVDPLIWAVVGALLSYPVTNRLSDEQSVETPRVSGEAVARSTPRRGPNASTRPTPPLDENDKALMGP